MKITLDTNCFFDYFEREPGPIVALINLQQQGYIEIAMTTRVMADTFDKRKGHNVSPIRKQIQNFPIVEVVGTVFRLNVSRLDSGDYLVSEADVNLLDRLHSAIADAQIEDLDHPFGHLKANRDMFVTNDHHFLDYQERLKQEFGILVLDPNDAVQNIEAAIARNSTKNNYEK